MNLGNIGLPDITLADAPTIVTLTGLEIILSADNAIVLAALAQTLPAKDQKRALYYGIAGAFILRFIAILCSVWIARFWFLQILGGGYLIWLAISHLTSPEENGSEEEKAVEAKRRSFWGTVAAIELTDLAFAVDSVLAAVALSSKWLVIYLGAVIGLIAMRFAATLVLKLLGIFPSLITYAYVMVLWIGLKLTWQGIGQSQFFPAVGHGIEHHIFWSVMLVIAAVGFLHYRRTVKSKG